MSGIKIEAGSLAELNQWIPAWLGTLSLARGQIVIDQIRGFLERSARCQGFRMPGQDTSVESPLVFLISTDSNGQRCAVLAAQSFSAPTGHLGADQLGDSQLGAGQLDAGQLGAGQLGDSATILHAGAWIAPWQEPSNAPSVNPPQSTPTIIQQPLAIIPEPLVLALDETMTRQGVHFLQWATDGGIEDNSILAEACRSIGMQKLATLEYLCASMDQLTLHGLERQNTNPANQPLSLVKINSENPNSENQGKNFDAFECLVRRTYQDTLDCPALSKFRSASQTLRAYQDVDSYDPDRWYFVVSRDDQSVPIGCVIMATHGDKNGNKYEGKDTVPTSELVYMALIPEMRGQGLGRSMVKLALSEPASRFSLQISSVSKPPQIVLAVDQQNHRARQLYLDAGLRPLLHENVWGKSVGDTLSTTT